MLMLAAKNCDINNNTKIAHLRYLLYVLILPVSTKSSHSDAQNQGRRPSIPPGPIAPHILEEFPAPQTEHIAVDSAVGSGRGREVCDFWKRLGYPFFFNLPVYQPVEIPTHLTGQIR